MEDTDSLRREIRTFLERAPKPEGLRNYGPTPTASDVAPGRVWHRYLAEHGYVCLHWPREYGGAEASLAFQAVFAEECAHAGVPRQVSIAGPDLVGPVLIKFGTAAQKASHLAPIRTGDHVWTRARRKRSAKTTAPRASFRPIDRTAADRHGVDLPHSARAPSDGRRARLRT